jgi:hypothetical protein
MSCACFASISSERGGAVAPRGRTARTCAGGKLPARSVAPLQRRRHFAEREIEHVVQQEGSALERRQPVERQEQRDGQIFGELRAAVRRERCRVNDRLRQPWTDVLLAPCARRGQHVETNACRRGHEKRSRVGHVVAVGKYVSCTASSASAIDPSMTAPSPLGPLSRLQATNGDRTAILNVPAAVPNALRVDVNSGGDR